MDQRTATTTIFAFIIGVMFIGVCGNPHAFASTQQGEQSSPSVAIPAIQAAEAPPMDPQMLREINEIRMRLGGGIAEQLKDMPLDVGSVQTPMGPDVTAESGAQRLARPTLNDPYGVRQIVGEPDFLQTVFEQHLQGLANGSVQRVSGVEGLEYVPQPSGMQVSRWREIARSLDASAADLEDCEMYEMADRIRDQAATLRLKARGR